MSETEIGYRTSDPEVLAEWDAWQDEMREQQGRVFAFKESVDPDRKLTLHAYRNGIPAFFRGDDVPEGWRRGANGNIVPNKRVKAGKAAAAELERLQKTAPREPQYRLKGVPDFVMNGDRWYTPGIFKYDGAVYISWGAVPKEIDTEIWAELKLSEFYAAKEAYEEQARKPSPSDGGKRGVQPTENANQEGV